MLRLPDPDQDGGEVRLPADIGDVCELISGGRAPSTVRPARHRYGGDSEASGPPISKLPVGLM